MLISKKIARVYRIMLPGLTRTMVISVLGMKEIEKIIKEVLGIGLENKGDIYESPKQKQK